VDVDRMAYEKQALAVLDSIYRLALWLSPREAAARDLVQETYLRALEARETFGLAEEEQQPAPGHAQTGEHAIICGARSIVGHVVTRVRSPSSGNQLVAEHRSPPARLVIPAI
jgi:hypothetical protein